MINEEEFIRQIDKTTKMLKISITRDYTIWMYHALGRVHEQDLDLALTDLLKRKDKELSFDKLQGYILNRRWERIEREEKEKKKQIIKMFHQGIKGNPCKSNHECGRCPSYIETLCSDYPNRSLQNIKDILAKKKTVEQVCGEMTTEFPGCGLEQYLPQETTF